MRNIMLDLETLDVIPSGVILSIGAVEFSDTDLGKEFHERIDIDSCLRLGMTVSGKTIQWWMGQDEKAKKLFDTDGRRVDAVLHDLVAAFEWKDTLVWANGGSFDIPMLENAFRTTGIEIPWGYNATRDYRTFKGEFSNEVYSRYKVLPMVAHDALDDARAQALTLQRLRQWRDILSNYTRTAI